MAECLDRLSYFIDVVETYDICVCNEKKEYFTDLHSITTVGLNTLNMKERNFSIDIL